MVGDFNFLVNLKCSCLDQKGEILVVRHLFITDEDASRNVLRIEVFSSVLIYIYIYIVYILNICTYTWQKLHCKNDGKSLDRFDSHCFIQDISYLNYMFIFIARMHFPCSLNNVSSFEKKLLKLSFVFLLKIDCKSSEVNYEIYTQKNLAADKRQALCLIHCFSYHC